MADDKRQPIVVKKIKKSGHGHHGGAWKVAYADFVTAMMAFFLMLWLLGSASGEQRQAIADFFQNPSAVQGPGGASTSMIQLGSAMDRPKAGDDGKDKGSTSENDSESNPPPIDENQEPTDEELEKRRMDSLLVELKKAIDENEALKPFKDQLVIQLMPEGLRIQILDNEKTAMFQSASSDPKYYTKAILRELAETINSVPNKISITGHTDATVFSSSRREYSNWELSAARANSARRELIIGGLNKSKIARVVGLGSSILFDKEHPNSALNRRISIIVMNSSSLKKLHKNEGNDPE